MQSASGQPRQLMATLYTSSIMRLSPTEVTLIQVAARDTLAAGSRVTLFGSRIDDSRRGGDIDLLVEWPGPSAATEVVGRRSAFAARLYRLLGERRIDIVMAPAGQPDARPVVDAARREGIELICT